MKYKLRSKLNERAETLPASIVTAIVSSLILLGVAGIIGTIVSNQAGVEASAELTTDATNIDVSLRADATNATLIVPNKQGNSVRFHIPSSEGQECKIIDWTVDGTSLTRTLQIFNDTVQSEDGLICSTDASALVVENEKVMATQLKPGSKFSYFNALGRELVVDGSGTVLPRDPSECPMGAYRVGGACPEVEPAVEAGWGSTKPTSISFGFTLKGPQREITREIEQNSSAPLYNTPEEAEEAAVSASKIEPPTPPVVNAPTQVYLGNSATISWSARTCPTDTVRSYTLYENNTPIGTITGTSMVRNYTNESLKQVTYEVLVNCSRGKLVVSSNKSATATVRLVPPAPTLSITRQPATSNAALNSPLSAVATCKYGTPRYYVSQTATTYGTPGSTSGTLTAVNNFAINSGFQVVQGAQYTYKVDAWCVTSANVSSSKVSDSTTPFKTLISNPTHPQFTAPTATAKVLLSVFLRWSASSCAVGTTVQYRVTQTMDQGATITARTVVTDTTALYATVKNSQGNKVRYNVYARCVGTAPATATDYVGTDTHTFTTLINRPTGITITSSISGKTITATASGGTCPTGTTLVRQMTNHGSVNDTYPEKPALVTTSKQTVTGNQGWKYVFYASGYCQTAFDKSNPSNEVSTEQIVPINKPTAPTLKHNQSASSGTANSVTFTRGNISCPTGTTAYYGYYRYSDDGYASAFSGWSTGNNNLSRDTSPQGVRHYMKMYGYCDGYWTNSATSDPREAGYIRVVDRPTNVHWTAYRKGNRELHFVINGTCRTANVNPYMSAADIASWKEPWDGINGTRRGWYKDFYGRWVADYGITGTSNRDVGTMNRSRDYPSDTTHSVEGFAFCKNVKTGRRDSSNDWGKHGVYNKWEGVRFWSQPAR